MHEETNENLSNDLPARALSAEEKRRREALAHAVLLPEDYRLIVENPVLNLVGKLNAIYSLQLVTSIFLAQENPTVFKWSFLGSIRMVEIKGEDKKLRAVALDLLPPKFRKFAAEQVKILAGGIGIGDCEKLTKNRFYVRLERDLSETDRLELAEHLTERLRRSREIEEQESGE